MAFNPQEQATDEAFRRLKELGVPNIDFVPVARYDKDHGGSWGDDRYAAALQYASKYKGKRPGLTAGYANYGHSDGKGGEHLKGAMDFDGLRYGSNAERQQFVNYLKASGQFGKVFIEKDNHIHGMLRGVGDATSPLVAEQAQQQPQAVVPTPDFIKNYARPQQQALSFGEPQQVSQQNIPYGLNPPQVDPQLRAGNSATQQPYNGNAQQVGYDPLVLAQQQYYPVASGQQQQQRPSPVIEGQQLYKQLYEAQVGQQQQRKSGVGRALLGAGLGALFGVAAGNGGGDVLSGALIGAGAGGLQNHNANNYTQSQYQARQAAFNKENPYNTFIHPYENAQALQNVNPSLSVYGNRVSDDVYNKAITSQGNFGTAQQLMGWRDEYQMRAQNLQKMIASNADPAQIQAERVAVLNLARNMPNVQGVMNMDEGVLKEMIQNGFNPTFTNAAVGLAQSPSVILKNEADAYQSTGRGMKSHAEAKEVPANAVADRTSKYAGANRDNVEATIAPEQLKVSQQNANTSANRLNHDMGKDGSKPLTSEELEIGVKAGVFTKNKDTGAYTPVKISATDPAKVQKEQLQASLMQRMYGNAGATAAPSQAAQDYYPGR